MTNYQSIAVAVAVISGIVLVQAAYGRDTLHNFNVQEAIQRGMDEGVLLDREFVSPIEFQCGAGNIIAGVALKGTVVQLK